jgi:hypothetical protein
MKNERRIERRWTKKGRVREMGRGGDIIKRRRERECGIEFISV